MKDTLAPLELIRAAFLALNSSHPDIVAKLLAVMKAESVPDVEAAFREAAVALVPTERDAAETLFTLAEVLAQFPRYRHASR